MSWDIDLVVPGLPDAVGWSGLSWNYTHNINGMINDAMRRAGIPFEFWPGSRAEAWRLERVEEGLKCGRRNPDQTAEGLDWRPCSMTCCDPSWWEVIDGRPGPEGLRIVMAVLTEWNADPDHYRKMDPPNGWGSFDRGGQHRGGVRRVFTEMAEAATTEVPLVWHGSG